MSHHLKNVGLVCGFIAAIFLTCKGFAAETRVTTNTWQGFQQLKFSVDGRDALLVLPKTSAPGRPWIWRTEFFGHEPQADLALLSNGWHVAYVNVQNLYGSPVALDHMDRFYEHLTNHFQLARKTVLEGFSRGGLFAFNWAARNPARVASIYADAPVCDFKSWPAGWGKGKGSSNDWVRCKQVYDLNDEQARAYRLNPVDNLAPLATAHIPILSVCGDADDGVPMAENTLLVKERYEKLGGEIQVITKPGVGHHPHSLRLPTPIVDFILKHAPAATTHGEIASPANYLTPVISLMKMPWPKNHTVNIVCHGHSVPSGYFKTPAVDSLHAYPNLLRVALAERYTNAVINVIVTAIGGENSAKGAARFDADVLIHMPDVVLIDYALNDRRIGLGCARTNWISMIEKAQAAGAKVILLTPTPDQSAKLDDANDPLNQHAEQIRKLAAECDVGLVDSLAVFKAELARGMALTNLMSQMNHPNARGHELVAVELRKLFMLGRLSRSPEPTTN